MFNNTKMLNPLFVVCLTILQIQNVFPQVISRPPLVNVFNRPVQETALEAPRHYAPQPYNPLPVETVIPNLTFPPPPVPMPPGCPVPPAATTIITDCSPSVCKNLANTLQLMIVCNLLQNTQGGSELAVQLAAPIINEVITSPNLSCACTNPMLPNPVPSTLPPTFSPLPPVISPNIYSNVIPNYINTPVINSNALFYSLL